jgi:hypothetical protein
VINLVNRWVLHKEAQEDHSIRRVLGMKVYPVDWRVDIRTHYSKHLCLNVKQKNNDQSLYVLKFIREEGHCTDKYKSPQVLNYDLPIEMLVFETNKIHAISFKDLILVKIMPISTKVDKYDNWDSQDYKTYKESSDW